MPCVPLTRPKGLGLPNMKALNPLRPFRFAKKKKQSSSTLSPASSTRGGTGTGSLTNSNSHGTASYPACGAETLRNLILSNLETSRPEVLPTASAALVAPAFPVRDPYLRPTMAHLSANSGVTTDASCPSQSSSVEPFMHVDTQDDGTITLKAVPKTIAGLAKQGLTPHKLTLNVRETPVQTEDTLKKVRTVSVAAMQFRPSEVSSAPRSQDLRDFEIEGMVKFEFEKPLLKDDENAPNCCAFSLPWTADGRLVDPVTQQALNLAQIEYVVKERDGGETVHVYKSFFVVFPDTEWLAWHAAEAASHAKKLPRHFDRLNRKFIDLHPDSDTESDCSEFSPRQCPGARIVVADKDSAVGALQSHLPEGNPVDEDDTDFDSDAAVTNPALSPEERAAIRQELVERNEEFKREEDSWPQFLRHGLAPWARAQEAAARERRVARARAAAVAAVAQTAESTDQLQQLTGASPSSSSSQDVQDRAVIEAALARVPEQPPTREPTGDLTNDQELRAQVQAEQTEAQRLQVNIDHEALDVLRRSKNEHVRFAALAAHGAAILCDEKLGKTVDRRVQELHNGNDAIRMLGMKTLTEPAEIGEVPCLRKQALDDNHATLLSNSVFQDASLLASIAMKYQRESLQLASLAYKGLDVSDLDTLHGRYQASITETPEKSPFSDEAWNDPAENLAFLAVLLETDRQRFKDLDSVLDSAQLHDLFIKMQDFCKWDEQGTHYRILVGKAERAFQEQMQMGLAEAAVALAQELGGDRNKLVSPEGFDLSPLCKLACEKRKRIQHSYDDLNLNDQVADWGRKNAQRMADLQRMSNQELIAAQAGLELRAVEDEAEEEEEEETTDPGEEEEEAPAAERPVIDGWEGVAAAALAVVEDFIVALQNTWDDTVLNVL